MRVTVDSEAGWGYRAAPPGPYRFPELRLELPGAALRATLDTFLPYAGRRHEAACFWYGTRDEAGNGVVRAVIVPAQINTWGNYQVTADAIAAIAARTRPEGWRNLAQVHTHPRHNVEHSWYDDENASSRRALSVVVPHYGVWNRCWPEGFGVHEFQEGYWHLLAPEDAGRRIVIVPEVEVEFVDLR